MRESYLPAPFAWIEIPAGKVTLVSEKEWAANYVPGGQTQTFDVPAFAIAKYPITNAQFAGFMEAGGYKNRQWWTDAGWARREKGGWAEPRYWHDNKWNGAEQPVVGVSWYVSVAFCTWLSEVSGKRMMLPTEQQRQRAAQGDDGRSYPWGNEWDCKRCNNRVSPCNTSNQTTPVTDYEGKGDSPYGVVDMSGNVWEWCLTTYDNGNQNIDGTDTRVLRGGSWDGNDVDIYRVDYRVWLYPKLRFNYLGFRIARSI